MIGQMIKDLSSAVVSNSNTITKVIGLIEKHDERIRKLEKEIRELKSKLQ